jgi:hypothetical protein
MENDFKLYGKKRPEISSIPTGQALELAHDFWARDIIIFCNLLISEFGREKAGELLRETRNKSRYAEGRAAAQKLGNPRDIDSYINSYFMREPPATHAEFFVESAKSPFWVAPGEFTYRTRSKAVYKTSHYCFKAMALRKYADEKMARFLFDNYCTHDAAWAKGFNPNMKYEVTRSFLLGDDCCEFTFEG